MKDFFVNDKIYQIILLKEIKNYHLKNKNDQKEKHIKRIDYFNKNHGTKGFLIN